MNISNLSKTITEIVKESQDKGTEGYDTPAEVIRIEDNIAWVHIPGGVDETPVKKTIDAVPGDTVQVRVADGTAWITGNESAPPTDDTTANLAKDEAKVAKKSADEASEQAQEATRIAGETNQYFWHTETGTDTGSHITEIPKEQFEANPAGSNVLIRSIGIAIRNALTELAQFAASFIRLGSATGRHVYIDETNGVDINDGATRLANFGSTVTIGKTANRNVVINDNGVYMKNANTVKARFSDNILLGETDNDAKNVWITNSALQMRTGTTVDASFGATSVIGRTSNRNIQITSTAMNVRDGSVVLAKFGDTVQIGNDNWAQKFVVSNDRVEFQGLTDLEGTLTILQESGGTTISSESRAGGPRAPWLIINRSTTLNGGEKRHARIYLSPSEDPDQNNMRFVFARNNTDAETLVLNPNQVHVIGDLDATGSISLKTNNKAIKFKNSEGTFYDCMRLNANDNLIIGYGGYDASIGKTYLDGNDVEIATKKDVTIAGRSWANTNKVIYGGGSPDSEVTSAATGKWVVAGSITLPAGVSHIDCYAEFEANATGYRRAFLSSNNTTDASGIVAAMFKDNQMAHPTQVTTCRFAGIVNTNSSVTYYIKVAQGSGSTLTVAPRVAVIQLR